MAMRKPGMPRPKMPNRTHNPGGGMPSMGTHRKPVGYGQHGKPFYNIKKYNQSKSGRAHAAAAKAGHPLSLKPVGYGAKGKAFFSKAKFAYSKVGRGVAKVKRTSAKGTTTRRRQRPR